MVPATHDGCNLTPCLSCLAHRNLMPEDWDVVDFWQVAHDQVVNHTPMASEHPWIAPRLEGWAAAADVYGFPAGPSRANLFDAARHLHEVIHGRTKTGRIHDMDPALLMPEEFRG